MKVLFVDPDWHFVQQARGFLEAHAHLVVYEPQPAAALQRALRWQPDVVVISAELPCCCDGSRLEELSQLRPRPAIVLTSSLARFDKAWRAWQRGGDEVLIKPLLHPNEIHAAIVAAMQNAICPQRRAAAHQPQRLSA